MSLYMSNLSCALSGQDTTAYVNAADTLTIFTRVWTRVDSATRWMVGRVAQSMVDNMARRMVDSAARRMFDSVVCRMVHTRGHVEWRVSRTAHYCHGRKNSRAAETGAFAICTLITQPSPRSHPTAHTASVKARPTP